MLLKSDAVELQKSVKYTAMGASIYMDQENDQGCVVPCPRYPHSDRPPTADIEAASPHTLANTTISKQILGCGLPPDDRADS